MHIKNKILHILFSALSFIMFDRTRSLIFSLIFVLLSLAFELLFNLQGIFSCSGAIITLCGLFLNIKHSLNFHLKIPKKNLHYKFSGGAILTSEPTDKDLQRVDEIIQDEIYGTIFMVVGTLIWAYGGYFVPINL